MNLLTKNSRFGSISFIIQTKIKAKDQVQEWSVEISPKIQCKISLKLE